ncbi:hypothetical protein [Mesorhizobium sp. KR1-2]|uniref:hypothetical protein n=1 Tax=Mesorhizobium sp. KR1-2 TaxID=3156609 RepID=UPI0032B4A3CC
MVLVQGAWEGEMFFLALWIICTGVTIVISSSRGSNAFVWFLVGILLGPVGVLMAIFYPISKSTQSIEKASQRRAGDRQ